MYSLIEDFCKKEISKYYEQSERKWGFFELSRSSFAYTSDLSSKKDIRFIFIHNKYDNVLFVGIENYNEKDASIFKEIYIKFIDFLKTNEIDTLISVFSYDEIFKIEKYEKELPLDYTGEKSEKIYSILNEIPLFEKETPTFQLSTNECIYSNWNDTFFKLFFKEDKIEVYDFNGSFISSLFNSDDAMTFVKDYIIK